MNRDSSSGSKETGEKREIPNQDDLSNESAELSAHELTDRESDTSSAELSSSELTDSESVTDLTELFSIALADSDSETHEMGENKISVVKLKGSENFHDWVFTMDNYLAMKGLSDCIVAEDAAAAVIVAKENDAKKLSSPKGILVLSMEKNLYPHIRKCANAFDIWKKVHELFEDRGHLRRSALLEQLVANKLENCDSMASYVADVMTTVSKMESVGLPVCEEWMVTFLIRGLTKEYNSFVMGLGASKITCDQLKMQLLDLDAGNQSKNNGEALFSKGKNSKKKNSSKKKQRKCYICDSPTHLSKACPKNENKGTNKNAHANNAICAFLSGTETGSNVWYIDSGASNHMTPNGNMLSKKQNSDIAHITAANNERIKVESVDSTTICADDGTIAVDRVLHVPGLAVNLLSVSKIVEHGNSVLFNKEGCFIKNSGNEMVASCKSSNGIYRIEAAGVCMLAKHKATAMEWHRKMGHINYQTLVRMKNDPAYGIAFSDDDHEIKNCEVCARGKQSRKTFPVSETSSQKILQLVHTDLAGPMENKSFGLTRYMLTFVDDYSKMVFLYFLKEKSQVLEKFIEFKNLMENQTGEKIKMIRSDNGGEYCSKEFDNFCKVNGIMHQLTAPHTPEQNGVAERMNRTIIEKARCMMFDSELSLRAWAEACQMASYIRNRTPIASLGFKCPQEIWSGQGVNVSLMKRFGTQVMVHVPKAQRTKWSEKSVKMFFVGYDTRSKAYRCLNTKNNKVIISRDVIFHENISPKVELEIDDEVDPESNDNATGSAEQEISGDETRTDVYAEDSDETITSSPANNSELNDTVVTLGNNTSGNSEFEDTTTDQSDVPSPTDDNDETFRTRAKVDNSGTPRRGKRVKKPYVPFQALALVCTEPNDAKEALEGDENIHWKEAMDAEMASHRKNGTWQLVKLPPNCKAIAGKWVFKRKLNNKGEIVRYKARFVAKGFAQRYGRDYNETFSPVVRHSTIRYLIALAVKNQMKIHQMDAETAFLQGDLEENVYMKQADAYDDNTGRVYHLRKAIYGLKQASRVWNLKLNNVLINHNFRRSKTDPCVYHQAGIIIAVYVDDFMIFYVREEDLLRLKQILHGNFNMKDIGSAASGLG